MPASLEGPDQHQGALPVEGDVPAPTMPDRLDHVARHAMALGRLARGASPALQEDRVGPSLALGSAPQAALGLASGLRFSWGHRIGLPLDGSGAKSSVETS